MSKQKGKTGMFSNKTWCLALSLLLIISMVPSNVFAFGAEETTEDMAEQISLVDEESAMSAEDSKPATSIADSEPAVMTEDSEPTVSPEGREQGPLSLSDKEATQSLEPAPGSIKEQTEEREGEFQNSISGMLWLDMYDDSENDIYAGDGIRQSEEQVLADYSVSLFLTNDTSNAIKTTTTDAGGAYEFENIEPGKYVVGVKATTIRATEYLLPFWYLDGTTGDNRFVASYDAEEGAYLYAYTESITMVQDMVIIERNAGLRTSPQLQPMAVNWTVSGGTIPGTFYATLPLAITAANNDTGTTYTITGGGGSESITSMLLVNAGKTITIDGGGAIVTQTSTRHFHVNGSLTLSNITLEGGNTWGGIQVQDNGSLIMESSAVIQNCRTPISGGGVDVSNGGTFSMESNAIIKDCFASTSGGGVCARSSSTAGSSFVLKDNASIQNCESTRGGGIYLSGETTSVRINGGFLTENTASYSSAGSGVGGAIYNFNATLEINGGIISGNKAEYGAGVSAGAYTANVTIAQFTITGGNISNNTATANGGGLYVNYGVTLNMTGGTVDGNAAHYGGGLYISNFATDTSINPVFNMTGGSVRDNAADYGAGLFTGTASAITLDGGKISGNAATYSGGGIYNNGSTDFKVISGEINGNRAANNGGGAYIVANRTFDITGGTISGNEANYGAGIFANTSSTITIDRGILDNNIAAYSGGGVYNNNATFTMSGSTTKISDNNATYGGGVYNDGIFNLHAGEIRSNTAITDGGGIYNDPMEVGGYANLMVGAGVVFDRNLSRQAVLPPTDLLINYPNIQSISSSIYTHPLNNHDISRTLLPVTVYYVDRSDNAIGTPSSTIHYAGYGSPFTLAPTDIPTISDYGFADWKIGVSGALQGNKTVWVDAVVPLTDGIYLVYGRDLGTSGEINDGVTPTTPNGVEDYDITRAWQMDDGTAISGLNDQIIIMDVGDNFTMAHNSGVTIPANLDYQGYYLSSDGGTTLHMGTPDYLINATEGDVAVTYVYRETPQPQVLTIDKFVSDAGDADYNTTTRNKAKNRPVAVDEVFGWDIFSSLPEDLDSPDAESYVVTDDLASYFDYEEGSLKVYSVPAMETPVASAYRLSEDSDYTLDFDAETNTLAVSLTESGMTLLGNRYTDDNDHYLMIKYDCKVNSAAKSGVSLFSGAEVDYAQNITRASVVTAATVEEEPEVNTGQIEISKLAEGTNEQLPDAEFGIASSEEDARAGNFIAIGSTDKNGQLTFTGLRFGMPGDGPSENSDNCVFWLVETKAPKGYKLMKEPAEIAFDSCQNEEGDYYFARIKVNNVVSSSYGDTTEILKKEDPATLSKTGDTNDIPFYLGLMAFALTGTITIALALLKRKSASGTWRDLKHGQ